MSTADSVRKWGALTVFIAQNAGVVLLMRYSRVHPGGAPYSSRVAVLVQELVKLPICSVLYAIECGGVIAGMRALYKDLTEQSAEWVQLAVPALLYTVQNNALFVGLTNLEAAVAHVTYQTKILFTALFSVCMLGRQLGKKQWIGLGLLVIGVICVQGLFDQMLAGRWSHPNHREMTRSSPPRAHRHHGPSSSPHPLSFRNSTRSSASSSPRSLLETHGSTVLGLSAMLTASLCTSFASVYFERMLKGTRKPSLWLRNIQLASYCAAIAVVGVMFEEDPLRNSVGWLHGFNGITWGVVMLNVAGGLLVAVTIKYADNILRGFAQAVAIIFGAVGSYFLFDFHFTVSFVIGVLFVIGAILIFGEAVTFPYVCEMVCGCVKPTVEASSPSDAAAEKALLGSQGEATGSDTQEGGSESSTNKV